MDVRLYRPYSLVYNITPTPRALRESGASPNPSITTPLSPSRTGSSIAEDTPTSALSASTSAGEPSSA
eukprot:14894667-Heterocapsa_arctica.AAC.1